MKGYSIHRYLEEGRKLIASNEKKFHDLTVIEITRSDLYEAFEAYTVAADLQSWVKKEVIKSRKNFEGYIIAEIETSTPLLFESFFVFSGLTCEKWDELKTFEDTKQVTADIENAITAYLIEGALVGVFNSTMVQRYVKLADRTETKVDATVSTSEPITGMQIITTDSGEITGVTKPKLRKK